MPVARAALFALVLMLPACSGGLSLSSNEGDAKPSPSTSSTAPTTTAAPVATGDGNDSGDESNDGSYTVAPRQARNDLTDPYCVDLEALFAAEHAYVDQYSVGYDFATAVAAYGDAASAALEHAPPGHHAALQEAIDFAATYGGRSYEEAEAIDGFAEAESEFIYRFGIDWFAEDFEFDEDIEIDDDTDLSQFFSADDYVGIHADEICGVDTDVSISIEFGDDGDFEFEFDTGDEGISIEFTEREEAASDVIGCVVIDEDTFTVSISNGATESVSYSGEVWFYDEGGNPTGTRSEFDVSSVRPGELVGDWHDSWEETGASCEIQTISGYSTNSANGVDPADACTFSPDGSTVDVTVSVVGPDEPASWLNVYYGLYDADGVRRFAGFTSVEYEPGQVAETTTFDFVDFEEFASCEIIAKERF